MQISLNVPAANSTQAIAISSASAQSAPLNGGYVVVTATVDCFVLRGGNPTAAVPTAGGANGALPLLAGVQYRLTGIAEGERLAFVCAAGGSGTAYVTPGA
jgi:hypothetical protein